MVKILWNADKNLIRSMWLDRKSDWTVKTSKKNLQFCADVALQNNEFSTTSCESNIWMSDKCDKIKIYKGNKYHKNYKLILMRHFFPGANVTTWTNAIFTEYNKWIN